MFQTNRINPNQTQIFYEDGRFETLTDEELEDLLWQMGLNDREDNSGQNFTQ